MAPALRVIPLWNVIVPADGTSAATGGNGDFGTSPIFGQLSDELLLVLTNTYWVPNAKHNSGSRSLTAEHFLAIGRDGSALYPRPGPQLYR